ncbi:MAG: hypothetical protein ACREMS_02265 [Gemmatimonadaceae bacterium]
MQFDGLEALQPGLPTIVVGTSAAQYDLHNDADLRDITFDFQESTLRLAWTLKEAAWRAPEHPKTSQRRTVASVTLLFSGIRSLRVTGEFAALAQKREATLAFLEYSRLAPGIGRVRVVLETGADLTVVANGCQLRTTGVA